ncbi:MAG: S9 family peptidase [Bacteroidetes bacterium]|nr:S9 family peptidase [Bacteroidota bacterium]MBL7103878.1 S9 family peptidase [Bacteroidales bacterium]
MIRYKKLQLFAILFSLSFFVFAQDKQLTLQDVVYMNPDILPKRLSQLQWMGKSDNFAWVADNKLVKCKPADELRDTIVSLDDINAGLTDLGVDSIKRFPRINFVEDYKFRFIFKQKLFLFDVISKNLILLNNYEKTGKNIDVCDESYAIAYTIDNNLYVALKSEQIQVTDDENKGIVNGQTVHRVEFGINTGTFWSPKGHYLAFYRKDETMVTDYPLVDIEPRIAEVKNTKYPMAGMTSHEVTLGVFNMKTRETIFLKTGEPKDHYLTCVTWDPSEKFIYVALLNRDQNHLKLNKYDVATGDLVLTLFEEKQKKYVEPRHPLYFLESKLGQFIWFSERDGYQHLYLYNTKGELIKQLTEGDWVVTGLLGTDIKERYVYFLATKESPLEQNIYSVEIKSGKVTRISPDHGTHRAIVSNSGEYIIDIFSSTDVAREYELLNSKGKVLQVLLKNGNPLKDYNLGKMSIFTVKADDGSDLYCRLIKPADFDSSKKYPVFIYVYGGPHSQLIKDSWLGAAGIFLNYMAQQGYVVFTMDNHGTANRGLEFEQAIFRNLGTLEVADQMKGVEYLKSLDYVDPERIGVDGWSYGGFLTISMMLKNPGVFKVACAGGPVIDWKYYEVMYGERYMDTPETNPEGYKNASLLNYVDHLEGKLLIINGTMDPTVVWQNSLSFVKKCVDEGIQVDYFVYPGHPHNVRGKDRMHLYEKIRSYFDENL